MKKLRNSLPAAAFLLLFLFLFRPALFSTQSLFSPDGPPYYVEEYASKQFLSFYASWNPSMLGIGQGCRPFYPQKFMALLLDPMVYHQWAYIASIAFAGFATWFYLRGRGFRGLCLWAGSAAMSFSGYHFTLISAGHRGVFDMTGWILLVFGALDRALIRKQWPYFAVVGAGTAHAMAAQPDITLIYLLAAGSYAIYLLVGQLRSESPKGLTTRLGAGGLLCACVFLLLSLNTFGNLFRNVIPERSADRGKSPEEKWIYATNWSLPPAEILEFALPGVRGLETGHPQHPYWGEVGRAHEWKIHQQGLKNLKQHTVYLGLVQLLFAGYLLGRSVKRNPEHPLPVARSWVWFWCGVWLFALLFALGRHAPFYQLIYALPRFDSIRAPIKFVHVMEWATVLLFAGGFATWLQDLKTMATRSLRIFGLACLAGTAFLVILRVGMIGRPEDAAELLGMQAALPAMKAGLSKSFTHGFLLTLLAGITCLSALRLQQIRAWLPGFFFIVLLFDLAYVGQPYVHTRDVSAHYADNPVARSLAEETPVPPRVSWRMPIPMNWHHPVAGNFLRNFTPYLEPAPHRRPDATYQDFFKAMPQTMQGYLRLLDLSSTTRVLCGKDFAALVERIPGSERLQSFAPATTGAILPTRPERAWGFLYGYQPALPRASIIHHWQHLEADEIPRQLFSESWDPRSTIYLTNEHTPSFPPTERPPSPATITEYRSNFIRVEGNSPEAGILLLVERWDPDWNITLNGTATSSYPVNHLMRGIELPAGEFVVDMHYAPFILPFALNLLTTACLWPGILFYALRKKQAKPKAA